MASAGRFEVELLPWIEHQRYQSATLNPVEIYATAVLKRIRITARYHRRYLSIVIL